MWGFQDRESGMETAMRRLCSSMSSRVHSKISLNLPIRLPIGRTSGVSALSVAKPLLSAESGSPDSYSSSYSW